MKHECLILGREKKKEGAVLPQRYEIINAHF